MKDAQESKVPSSLKTFSIIYQQYYRSTILSKKSC